MEFALWQHCNDVEGRMHNKKVLFSLLVYSYNLLYFTDNITDFIHYLFSQFLGNIRDAFEKNANLTNLLLDDFFTNAIHKAQVLLFCFEEYL